MVKIRLGVSDENSIKIPLDKKIEQAKSVVEEGMKTDSYMIFCVKAGKDELMNTAMTHNITSKEMIEQFSLFLERLTGNTLKETLKEIEEDEDKE